MPILHFVPISLFRKHLIFFFFFFFFFFFHFFTFLPILHFVPLSLFRKEVKLILTWLPFLKVYQFPTNYLTIYFICPFIPFNAIVHYKARNRSDSFLNLDSLIATIFANSVQCTLAIVAFCSIRSGLPCFANVPL